jgi:cell division septum initiation protein DivIVA
MKRGLVRSVLLAVVLACGWQAAVAAPVLAERGPGATRPDPTTLWKAYPLKPREQPLKPREQPLPPTKPKPAPSAAQTRITAPGSSDGWQFSPLLLVSVVLVLAILAGGVLVVSHGLPPAWAPAVAWRSTRARPLVYGARHPPRLLRQLSEGGLTVNNFVHRFLHLGGERDDDGSEVVAGTSETAGPVNQRDISTSYSMRRQERNKTVQTRNPTPQSGSDTGEASVDGGHPEVARAEQIGEHVAAVLGSAEQAAEKIREAARQDAERIRAEAKDKVAATLSEAKLEAERAHRESEQLRADADAYDKQTREAADRYTTEMRVTIDEEVAQRRAEVDEQVREIQWAAKRKAKDVETEARARQKALVQQVEHAEARLEQLLGIFRGMTLQLEGLVSADSAGRSGDAEEQASVAEPLDEALKPRPSASRSPGSG